MWRMERGGGEEGKRTQNERTDETCKTETGYWSRSSAAEPGTMTEDEAASWENGDEKERESARESKRKVEETFGRYLFKDDYY